MDYGVGWAQDRDVEDSLHAFEAPNGFLRASSAYEQRAKMK